MLQRFRVSHHCPSLLPCITDLFSLLSGPNDVARHASEGETKCAFLHFHFRFTRHPYTLSLSVFFLEQPNVPLHVPDAGIFCSMAWFPYFISTFALRVTMFVCQLIASTEIGLSQCFTHYEVALQSWFPYTLEFLDTPCFTDSTEPPHTRC